jgi:hypothetical protein
MLGFIDNRTSDPGTLFDPLPRNSAVAPRLSSFDKQDFPKPGTPAWNHFNRRRAELIRSKIREGLSCSEERELAWLQRETLAAVDRAFPRPPVNLHDLTELEMRKKEDFGLELP